MLESNAGRHIREEEGFRASVEQLGGAKAVDFALEPILEALSNRPEGFDLVPGYEPIRMAKTTTSVLEDRSSVPAIRVWFKIINATTVSLLYAEKFPDSEE